MQFPLFCADHALILGVLCALSSTCSFSAAPEPEINAKDLPRHPALEPTQALGSFQVKPGFQIQLVASEPLVMSPVALSFDENGRLYVVEMRDYSERRDEHLGRIRLLEDTDGDGVFDKSTVFADNLPWPTAVLCYDGGIFVGATPDILYLKDTNGDGIADSREVVFTGFGAGVQRLNVQQLFNSFTWGLDNRIYGANGGNGGTITSLKHPEEKPLELRGRDFSFDPRTLMIRAESGGGQYGLSFDTRGRKFVCSNSSHIRAVMYEDRYSGANPFFPLPPAAVDIAVDGPAAEVYRISPDEPWRVIRTQWRVSGLVPGPIEGGGRPSGYFTGATGITIYRGNAFPAEFIDDAFVADCGSNLVHRKKVSPQGAGYSAARPADEQNVEFLASRDNWFRPVQMANAPDGTLYVIDMYREVIEHPWSLPQSLKKHLDLNSGNDRGRIYRIVPNGFRQPPLPRLGNLSVQELVATLAHPNGWHRDTAARLLYQLHSSAAVEPLRKLLRASPSPLGRMHALYAFDSLDHLQDEDMTVALADGAPAVRQHAVRLAELHWHNHPLPQAAVPLFTKLASDPDPQVRYQLAFSLGQLAHPQKADLLINLARRDCGDGWMRVALLTSMRDFPGQTFETLTSDATFVGQSGSEPLLSSLAAMIGARNDLHDTERALDGLGKLRPAALACAVAGSLGEGLQRAGGSFSNLWSQPGLAPLISEAHQLLADQAQPSQARLAALHLLSQGPFDQNQSDLVKVLAPDSPMELQKAAIKALAAYRDAAVSQHLLSAWTQLTPTLRFDVVDALLRRPERIAALLNALENGTIQRSDLSTSQINTLRQRTSGDLQAKANRLLGVPSSSSRQDVINSFSQALELHGHAAHGQAIYLERCASCHRLAGQGHALGPDLESVRASGKEAVLTNILDPNREVMPKYLNYLAQTKDDETFTGLISQETDANLTLRQPNGNETTLARANLVQLRSLGQSAMPEGLEQGLKAQDVADLLEYILTAAPKN